MAYFKGVLYSVVLCMTNDVARKWQKLPSKVVLFLMTLPIQISESPYAPTMLSTY